MRFDVTMRNAAGDLNVLVDCDPSSPVLNLVERLVGEALAHVLIDGKQRSLDHATVDEILHHGSIISIAPATMRHETGSRPDELDVVEVVVTQGVQCGATAMLGVQDSMVIGSAPDCDFVVSNSHIAPQHLRLATFNGALVAVHLAPGFSSSINNTPLQSGSPVMVEMGDQIQVGPSAITVQSGKNACDPHCTLAPTRNGRLVFNRPPHLRPIARSVTVTMPQTPPNEERSEFPWMQCLLPLVLALVAAWLFGRPEMLLFALMSPVLTLTNAVGTRRLARRRGRMARTTYDGQVIAAHARIDEIARHEVATQALFHPRFDELLDWAAQRSERLWERRITDDDALAVRVGIHDRRSHIVVEPAAQRDSAQIPWLHGVAATLDLRACGVVGVCGPAKVATAHVSALLGSLAALLPPSELRYVLLSDAEQSECWSWLQWLPHVSNDSAQTPFNIGNTDAAISARLDELDEIIAARSAIANGADRVPALIVVLDHCAARSNDRRMRAIFERGPAVGVHLISIEDAACDLPQEALAILRHLDTKGSFSLEIDAQAHDDTVIPDLASAQWCERIARALARITHQPEDHATVLPDATALVELLKIDFTSPTEVANHWSQTSPSTVAAVGVGFDGAFTIDLQRDGPHALVAGTTGSGKSEFLQTLIASLAATNPPDMLNFVLVDFKGGSAFSLCARLPHTVGMVTNLDQQLTQRALASLDAELKRREAALATLAVPDVDRAWLSHPEQAAREGLARLVIVIDEFAELAMELPAFVSGLVRIARVGRSLGIHLVLATQRPAGVITPEIRANTSLRIALRVEDSQDSQEVIGCDNAASIDRTKPGRAFAKLGGARTIVEFQSGRVAGSTAPRSPSDEIFLKAREWNTIAAPVAFGIQVGTPGPAIADIEVLVDTLTAASVMTNRLATHRPWLEPLRARYVSDDATIAIIDLPPQQAQWPVVFSLDDPEHWLIAGASRSGRTTALRAVCAAIARTVGPDDCHLYVFDAGGGALHPVCDLAHCGTSVRCGTDDPLRIERLAQRLAEEVRKRLTTLANEGYGTIAEQRTAAAPTDRMPFISVCIDRWDTLAAQFPAHGGSELIDNLHRVARDGASVGIRMFLTGDRSILGDRITSCMSRRFVLRLNDANDYRMADINPRLVPAEILPGRAIEAGSHAEVQFALLDEQATTTAQLQQLCQVARRSHDTANGLKPFRVDALPEFIEFKGLSIALQDHSYRDGLTIGVTGDELATVRFDLDDMAGIIIAGPRSSGRSNAILVFAQAASSAGLATVIIAPKLARGTRCNNERTTVVTGDTASDLDNVRSAILADRCLVLIDDAAEIARSPLDDWLLEQVSSHSSHIAGIAVAGAVEYIRNETRGVVGWSKRAQCGLLLSPASTLDGDLLGTRLDRSHLGGIAGRGIYKNTSGVHIVQMFHSTLRYAAPLRDFSHNAAS